MRILAPGPRTPAAWFASCNRSTQFRRVPTSDSPGLRLGFTLCCRFLSSSLQLVPVPDDMEVESPEDCSPPHLGVVIRSTPCALPGLAPGRIPNHSAIPSPRELHRGRYGPSTMQVLPAQNPTPLRIRTALPDMPGCFNRDPIHAVRVGYYLARHSIWPKWVGWSALDTGVLPPR